MFKLYWTPWARIRSREGEEDTGLHVTAEGTQHFDRRIAADLDDVLGGSDGETRERGLLKEAGINRLAVAAHRDRPVGAAAASI
jgi:hypothetical protein